MIRALVNMSGAIPGEWILDPFCGTGGTLIEASLIGCRAAGTDADPEMIAGSRINLPAAMTGTADARYLPFPEWLHRSRGIRPSLWAVSYHYWKRPFRPLPAGTPGDKKSSERREQISSGYTPGYKTTRRAAFDIIGHYEQRHIKASPDGSLS